MNRTRRVALFLTLTMVTMLVVGSLCFGADKYPTKPIQAIVPFAAGGSSDMLARAVEKIWPKYSTQPMIVINKPGAGGVLGEEFVVRSEPDGYTIYIGQGSGHDLVMPHLQKMPFDPLKDIAPVARLSIHSAVVCVSGKSSIKSMKDLIEYAHKGNRVTAAVATAGGSNDLVMKAIAKRANISITTVPFAGGAESTTALAGGHLTMGSAQLSEVLPHIKAGRFRPIGIALEHRDSTLPNLPTLREQGVDVAVWGSVKGVAAPLRTPPEIIEYLSSTLRKVCEDKEFKQIMAKIGQPIDYLNTKDWTAFLPKASKDYGDLIKELDIKM
jgi:tripartite-type tricarboxylate transporter receptor subunit TctC